MFFWQKIADTRSTKALRDSAAFHESQPTPTTLVQPGTIVSGTFHTNRSFTSGSQHQRVQHTGLGDSQGDLYLTMIHTSSDTN